MKDIKDQCTTLEQSKKLVELGFTKDTASLMWENFSRGIDIDERLWAIGFAGGMHPETTHLKLPCWTIADMLSLIDHNHQTSSIEILNNQSIYIVLRNNDCNEFYEPNLRDSLFDCILWMNKNKYL